MDVAAPEAPDVWLRRRYVDECASYRQIAAELGYAPGSGQRGVRWLLGHFGIDVRRGSDAVRTQWLGNDERRRAWGAMNRERILTHGCSIMGQRTPEYRAWCGMRERCSNESHHAYSSYGGRGIQVCERWNSFESFLEDMGPRPTPKHSLDRIDNDGNYCPENCRWATKLQQTRNRRTSDMLTINGRQVHLHDAAHAACLAPRTLKARLRSGWPLAEALATPAGQRARRSA